MAKKDKMASLLERVTGLFRQEYQKTRAEEQEELHNAIVDLIVEHNIPLEKAISALGLVVFQLRMAQFKQIEGVVKLTEKPPLAKAKKK